MNKPTVLLDVDNTILDNEALFGEIARLIDANYGEKSSEKFFEILEDVGGDLGYKDWKEAALRFAKAMNSSDYASVLACFLEVPFKNYFFAGSEELIDFLGSNTNLIIFSDGDNLFQKTKIKQLGLEEKASEVIVSKSKVDLLPGLRKKYDVIIVIDDKPSVIEAAKNVSPKLITVWIKYGRHVKGTETLGADLETSDLKEVKEFIKEKIH